MLGTEIRGTYPFWRLVLCLPVQLGLLPALFALGWWWNGDLTTWGASWVEALEQMKAGDFFSRRCQFTSAFVYIFAAFLAVDFFWIDLDVLMVAHHVTCLVGHGLAAVVFPAGFPWYFAGVICLEIGSMGNNLLDALEPSPGKPWRAPLAYAQVVLMSLSHVGTLWCVAGWAAKKMPYSASSKVFGVSLTLVLAAVREHEAIRAALEASATADLSSRI